MRQVLARVALVALLISLAGLVRCKQRAGESGAGVPRPLSGAEGRYQFAAETGFSVDLGKRPEFTPAVPEYRINPDLSNVANLKQFREDLRPDHLRTLARQGFVVVPADWKQMEFVYELNNYELEHLPSVVTVDSALHAWHIFYDYVLRSLEVSTLYERASTLAVGVLQGTMAQYEQANDKEIKEAALFNAAYALVPVKLLEIPETEWGVAVPGEVTTLANQELTSIKEHTGMKGSATVGALVDFSQFIPRGHYTRSDKLKRYFLAMMWYGLVPQAFYNKAVPPALQPRVARQAVLLSQVVLYGKAGEEPLGKVWEDLYEPTAFMVGFADDLTPDDMGQGVAKVLGEPLDTKKLLPEQNLVDLAKELLAIRPPGIVMASLTGDPNLPGIPQFRLMGQRFVLDSYLFQMMVAPHVGSSDYPNHPGTFNTRTFPMGLDVMSILGSQRAYEIADKVYEQTRFKNYAEQTEKLRAEVAAYTDADWTKNIYAGWLQTLGFLVEPKQDGYPMFMRSEAWLDKQLNAALGSWAELRHDTILYAKQSVVAECGGGPEEEPPPPPKGYVEPEVLTYWRLGLLATQLRDGLAQRKLLADEQLQESFDELISLLKFLQEVSVKELTNVKLSQEEYDAIEYYGAKLERLNQYTKRGSQGDEITSATDKDMAVIADVHTGPIGDRLYALQEGVGHAHELYVVYPVEGKLQIGRGAVFSYHEFTVPIEERMTDEDWQAKLASPQPPQPPKWTASFLSRYKRGGEQIEFSDVAEFTTGGC